MHCNQFWFLRDLLLFYRGRNLLEKPRDFVEGLTFNTLVHKALLNVKGSWWRFLIVLEHRLLSEKIRSEILLLLYLLIHEMLWHSRELIMLSLIHAGSIINHFTLLIEIIFFLLFFLFISDFIVMRIYVLCWQRLLFVSFRLYHIYRRV